MAEPNQASLAGEVAELRKAVAELSEAVRHLAQAAPPPVRVSVGEMEVERLAFFVPSIDVEQISGALNIGITHLIKPADQGEQPTAKQPPPEPAAESSGAVELWPNMAAKGDRP